MYIQKLPMRHSPFWHGDLCTNMSYNGDTFSLMRDFTQNIVNIFTIQHQTCVDEILNALFSCFSDF